jgi:tRNA-specific 2-thiouridylase
VAERPLFVLGADPRANTVRVGPHESLARTQVAATGSLYVDVDRADAKLRYRSPPVPSRVVPTDDGFALELDEPVYGVAAGQAAVLYDGDAVVGCGLLSSGDCD